MKLDFKQVFNTLYKSSAKKITVVTVPEQRVISIEGTGDPNTSIDFKQAVEALFSVAYTLKFTYKKIMGKSFVVMPLEGLWWTPDMKDFSIARKDRWVWKIFIVQPDFIAKEAFDAAIKQVREKKNPVSLEKVKFEVLHEGMAAQILYVGPFADEGPTIQKIHDYIRESGHTFNGLQQKHHEIYLSDMRKTDPKKLRTIIRQPFV